jgi:hypothetical protein
MQDAENEHEQSDIHAMQFVKGSMNIYVSPGSRSVGVRFPAAQHFNGVGR